MEAIVKMQSLKIENAILIFSKMRSKKRQFLWRFLSKKSWIGLKIWKRNEKNKENKVK